MTDKKEWFRYVPSDKSDEERAYSWRISARNYVDNLLMFPNFPLYSSVIDGNLDYDEWYLKTDLDKIRLKIYGSQNQIVKDSRIEFECEPSKKNLVNKLIEEIHL